MKKKQPKPVKAWGYLSEEGILAYGSLTQWHHGTIPIIIRTLADDQERSRRIRELEKEVETLKSRLPIRLNFGDKFRRPKR